MEAGVTGAARAGEGRRALAFALLALACGGAACGLCRPAAGWGAGPLLAQAVVLASAAALVGQARRWEREGARLADALRRAPGPPLLLAGAGGRVAEASLAAARWFGAPLADGAEPVAWESLFVRDESLERLACAGRRLAAAGAAGPARGAALARLTGGAALPARLTCSPLGCRGQRGAVLHVADAARCAAAERELAARRAAEGERLAMIGELFASESCVRGITGASLAAAPRAPARAGGEFMECVPWGGEICDVAAGDAMGAGLAAALLAVEARGALLQAVLALLEPGGSGRPPPPERVVDDLRRRLAGRLAAREAFVALAYARFDFEAREMLWVDCGHAPLLHWQAAAGRAVALKGENTPLGVVPGEACEVGRARLGTGDVIVLASDSVVGARGPGGEVFGVERLRLALEACAGGRAQEVAHALRRRVAEFVGRDEAEDETRPVVCVRVHKPKSVRCRRRWTFDSPAQLSGLSRFRRHVQAIYEDAEVARDVTPQERDLMLLALHEVQVNIIEHAVRQAEQVAPAIHLETNLFEDRLEWTFQHGMAFFSPTRVHAPSADGSQSCGYGLYIIREVADRVQYYRNGKGESCVKLIKWFRREGGGEAG